jgi:hypothetical protein
MDFLNDVWFLHCFTIINEVIGLYMYLLASIAGYGLCVALMYNHLRDKAAFQVRICNSELLFRIFTILSKARRNFRRKFIIDIK